MEQQGGTRLKCTAGTRGCLLRKAIVTMNTVNVSTAEV